MKLKNGQLVARLCALLGILMLIPIPTLLANPSYINCGSGNQTWTGYVNDQEGSGISGVVVYIQTETNYQPAGNGMTQTGSNGAWSITLNTPCPINASFYWTGPGGTTTTTSRPLMLSVAGYSTASTETVNVWEQAVNYDIFYGYPDSGCGSPCTGTSESVSVSTTGSYTIGVSADASINGAILTGFLSGTADSSLGTTLSIQDTSGYSLNTNNPFIVYYPSGYAIKVEDTSGNYLTYVEYYSMSSFSAQSTTEWISSSTARTNDDNKGVAPFDQVPGCSGSGCQSTATYSTSLSTQLTVSAQVGVDFSVAWGAFQLTTTFSFTGSSGTTVQESLTLTDSNSQNACFIVYFEGSSQTSGGVDLHAWFYGYYSGNCPSS